MDFVDTHYGRTNTGETIYHDIDRDNLTYYKAVHLFREILQDMKKLFPEFTIEKYHELFHNKHHSLKKYISWGDSFMIDTTIFRVGGARRFIDYPGIDIPYIGYKLTIDGKEHVITNFGLLTFDTEILTDDYLEDQEDINN